MTKTGGASTIKHNCSVKAADRNGEVLVESDLGKAPCPCGKAHEAAIDEILAGSGVLARLPELVRRYKAKKPFLLCDVNTWAAAGERVQGLLQAAGIPFGL